MKNTILITLFLISSLSFETDWFDYFKADYFVSATTGNDNNDGTAPWKAWATISKVNNAEFVAGDRIAFKRGEMWRGESLIIDWSGAENNPITFKAYGQGAKPVFNGAVENNNWTQKGATNLWRTKSPLTEPFRTVVVIDDDIFMPVNTLADLNANLEFFVEDSVGTNGDSIYVYSTTNPNSRIAELSTKGFGIVDGVFPDVTSNQYITIKDLELRYYGYAGIDFRGTQPNGNVLIENCNFYHNMHAGVQFYNGHEKNIVQNCTVSYCGNGLYSNVADKNSFIGNTITNTLFYQTGLLYTDGHAIGMFDGDSIIAENNYIAYGNSALIGVDNASVIIRYNEVHAGFVFNGGGGVVCSAMTIFDINPDIPSNVYYNLMIADSTNSYCFAVGITGSSIGKKLNMYNNTFVQKKVYDRLGRLTVSDSITMKNNVFYTNGISIYRMLELLTSGSPKSDYNLWYDNSVDFYVDKTYTPTAQYATLAAWTTASSQDGNSVDGKPIFVNSANNYAQQYGSIGINEGVSVGLTRDILGNPIEGLPDIGAYEYNGNSDVIAPVVTAFTIPSTSFLTVNITAFNVTDNVAVTGYMITESATAPLASNTGWTATAPTSYIFSTPGNKTLYAWARDITGNVSLSASDQVVASYDLSTLDDGLIAWYDFDETTGLLQDLSGNGLHAASHATNITINQAGNPTQSYLFNTADGGTQRITINDNSLLTPADSFTIVMWVNLNAVNRYHTLIGKVGSSNLEYLAFIDSGNKLFFNIYQNGTTTKTSRSTTNTLANNTDYCIMFQTSNILAASAGKIFINNSEWASSSVSSSTITNVLDGTGNVTIGNEAQVNYTGLSANISQIIIYGRILTADEKTAINSGISFVDL